MEELFSNFIQHIEKLISPNLAKTLKSYMKQQIAKGITADDYSTIERDIKMIMADYFQKAKDKEYVEMATNLFNSFVEMDDANLLRAVKYFIRIYSYFQEIQLKKKLYQWRINVIKRKKASQQTQQGNMNNSNINYTRGKTTNKSSSTSNYHSDKNQQRQWGTNY